MLTTICLSSGYPEAIPIPDMRSESIIEDVTLVFSRLGYPRELQMDLGPSFTSNLTTTFLRKFGVKIIPSSVCHSSSNLIEHWHRSVKKLVKVLSIEYGSDWEINLPHMP